jgi:NTP pyrophosphatase (non-canonical NTP hydrolase)
MSDQELIYRGSFSKYYEESIMITKENMIEIDVLSNKESANSSQLLMKLMEEVGELTAAYLKSTGSPNASASADENILEELADVCIVALSIAHKITDSDFEEFNKIISLKLSKWRMKQAKLSRDKNV